jgi:hypothetical protein
MEDTYVRPPAVTPTRVMQERVTGPRPAPPERLSGPRPAPSAPRPAPPAESGSAGRARQSLATAPVAPPPAQTEVAVPAMAGPLPELMGDPSTTSVAQPLARKTQADGPGWRSPRNLGFAVAALGLLVGGAVVGPRLLKAAPRPPPPPPMEVVVAPPPIVEHLPEVPPEPPPPVPPRKGSGKPAGKAAAPKPAPAPRETGEVQVVKLSPAEAAELECEGEWKEVALSRIGAGTNRRKAKVSGVAEAAEREKIDTRDFGLRVLVNEANKPADCKEALLQIGLWAK